MLYPSGAVPSDRFATTELTRGVRMSRFFQFLAALVLVALAVTGVAGCSPTADPLDGTEWRLVGWSVSSIDPASVTITASFADAQVSGTGGVNSYFGPYEAGSDGAFSAGPLAATEMAGPEPAMRAEAMYLTLLGEARSFRITGSQLTLLDGGGNESLIFERTGE